MKKILIVLLFLSSNAIAEVGVVVKDRLCGKNVIIKLSTGEYIGAKHYIGTELKTGMQVQGLFLSSGMRNLTSSNNFISRYWIVSVGETPADVVKQICYKPRYPIL